METYYDNLYKDKKQIFGKKPVPFAEKVLKYKHTGTLLDIGSGYGRNALFFASHGFEVTAIDNSSEAISQLRENATKEGFHIEAVIENIQNITLKENYDVILILFVLHRMRDKEAQKAILYLKKYTKLGGIHVLAAFTKEGDFFRLNNNRNNNFYLDSGVLKTFYQDWQILEWEEHYTKAYKKTIEGKPMVNKTSFLIAMKQ